MKAPSPPPGTPESKPTRRRLAGEVAVALMAALLLLVSFVLPAEYGIDPTGVGHVLGLDRLYRAGTTDTGIKLSDAIGGNEKLDLDAMVAAGDPLPLPNPAVHQEAVRPATMREVKVELPVGGETEVKAVMRANQVLVYSWHTDGGPVYFDFHGHSPDWKNKEAFVRYQESKEGLKQAQGSLVAPFSGEHGWYWVNLADHPVKITLVLNGYFDDVRNYGVH